MDNLIVFVPFLLGLILFSVLYAAERLSARRHRRKVERRLITIRRAGTYRVTGSLTYPNIPKPYQRRLP